MLAARNRPDAFDLAQPIRGALDDVEDLLTECADEFPGVDRSYAKDHARREVSLDPVGGRRDRGAQEPRFELLAVGPIVDPLAGGHDPLAGGNDSHMAHHRHRVTMSARPRAQDAKTVLSVVVGHSLVEACQHFPGIRLRTHAIINRVAAFAEILRPTSVWNSGANQSAHFVPFVLVCGAEHLINKLNRFSTNRSVVFALCSAGACRGASIGTAEKLDLNGFVWCCRSGLN